MKKLLIIPVFVVCVAAYGQQPIQYDQDVIKYFNEGVSYYESENYKDANRSFRKALSTNAVLPGSLSYYFAETLYHLGQYQNSKNFVVKYLGMTGYVGDFYVEATNLSDLLDAEFIKIKNCKRCNVFGYRLVACDQCDASGLEIAECHRCKGLGNSLCPKCTGEGVIITLDAFGQNLYEECDKCNGEGHVICELCEGTKIITRTCVICLGSRVKASSTVCNHQDDQTAELFEKKKLR